MTFRNKRRFCLHLGLSVVLTLLCLPAIAQTQFSGSEKVATRVSSLALVRHRGNDYSAPTSYGHRDVLVKGYVHEVVSSRGA
jgi:hypothetical protein